MMTASTRSPRTGDAELLDDPLASEDERAEDTIMIAAAAVIVPPVAESPRRTAARLSPVRSHSSWIRITRNTS